MVGRSCPSPDSIVTGQLAGMFSLAARQMRGGGLLVDRTQLGLCSQATECTLVLRPCSCPPACVHCHDPAGPPRTRRMAPWMCPRASSTC